MVNTKKGLGLLLMSVVLSVSAFANSLEFQVINGFGTSIKKELKAKTPSTILQSVQLMYEQMGQPSDFDDYVAPVVDPKADPLFMAYEQTIEKSEMKKIKKLNLFKAGTMQRDWVMAMTTSALPMIRRTMADQYAASYDFVVSLWGSKKFVDQQLNQITDFYIEGALMGQGITEEADLVVARQASKDALK
jgi:hypothetical protein